MLSDLISKKFFISLEFFPPKNKQTWPKFFAEVKKLKRVNPLFVSVTYGAGGSSQAYTLELAKILKTEFGLETMAHLTCIGASKQKIRLFLDDLLKIGINNVLALRGDPPKNTSNFDPSQGDFRYGVDLVRFIRKEYANQFSIGVAGYPEGHAEAPSLEEDLKNLKLKVDAGADFVLTQLFFENSCYFNFVQKAKAIGITVPIIPGLLPIIDLAGVKRFTSLCKATLPASLLNSLEKANQTQGSKGVLKVGLNYARKQFLDLKEKGAPGVHFYTLNQSLATLYVLGFVNNL